MKALTRDIVTGWRNYWMCMGAETGAFVALMALIAIVTGATFLGSL